MTSAPLHRGSKRPLQLIPSLGGSMRTRFTKEDEFESVHGGPPTLLPHGLFTAVCKVLQRSVELISSRPESQVLKKSP